MDIKKFLKDNKGCPLTVPAIKQLLVKFIELLSKKGVVKDEVSNIREISKETLDELQVGDIVQKITGNQKHAYMVTYKGDGAGEGICLTYCAAGYMETVSYDRSGTDWVYNSTDVFSLTEEEMSKLKNLLSKVSFDEHNLPSIYSLFVNHLIIDDEISLLDLTALVNFELEPLFPFENNAGKALVINNDENGVEAVSLPSGGVVLYEHRISLSDNSEILIINNSSSQILNKQAIENSGFVSGVKCMFMNGNYGNYGMVLFLSAEEIKYYESDTSSIVSYDLTIPTIVSDTVTQL